MQKLLIREILNNCLHAVERIENRAKFNGDKLKGHWQSIPYFISITFQFYRMFGFAFCFSHVFFSRWVHDATIRISEIERDSNRTTTTTSNKHMVLSSVSGHIFTRYTHTERTNKQNSQIIARTKTNERSLLSSVIPILLYYRVFVSFVHTFCRFSRTIVIVRRVIVRWRPQNQCFSVTKSTILYRR